MEIVSGKTISLRDIFISSWAAFQAKYESRIRPVVLENINKILLCRTGQLGFASFACSCGYSKKVPFTCKSRFCSSCGKIACDKWMDKVISWSLPNMQYHHIVFTIPEQLRVFMILFRKIGLDALFTASKNAILQLFADKYGCTPGIISIIHTFGSDIKWNPHVHIIVTSGGLSSDKRSWVWANFIPFNFIRNSWKFHLIKGLRSLAKSHLSGLKYSQFKSLLSALYQKEWYVNVGHKLNSLAFTIRYIGRYSKRPVLAETRLLGFDGQNVSFSFKDKITNQLSVLSFPVFDFIGKLVRHIPDKHHRMIRYSGIFANRVKSTSLLIVKTLISSGKKYVNYTTTPSLSWRNRLIVFFGFDPLLCPRCLNVLTASYSFFLPRFYYSTLINHSP
jgi:hypothetical protein